MGVTGSICQCSRTTVRVFRNIKSAGTPLANKALQIVFCVQLYRARVAVCGPAAAN